MLGIILQGIFIVLLFINWFQEGWMRVLKILGLWLGSAVVLFIALRLLGVDTHQISAINWIIGLSFWGLWDIGLAIYCIKEGYIGKF